MVTTRRRHRNVGETISRSLPQPKKFEDENESKFVLTPMSMNDTSSNRSFRSSAEMESDKSNSIDGKSRDHIIAKNTSPAKIRRIAGLHRGKKSESTKRVVDMNTWLITPITICEQLLRIDDIRIRAYIRSSGQPINVVHSPEGLDFVRNLWHSVFGTRLDLSAATVGPINEKSALNPLLDDLLKSGDAGTLYKFAVLVEQSLEAFEGILSRLWISRNCNEASVSSTESLDLRASLLTRDHMDTIFNFNRMLALYSQPQNTGVLDFTNSILAECLG